MPFVNTSMTSANIHVSWETVFLKKKNNRSKNSIQMLSGGTGDGFL